MSGMGCTQGCRVAAARKRLSAGLAATLVCSASFAVGLAEPVSADDPVPVNFTQWTREGLSGTWVVNASQVEVQQTLNGEFTSMISPEADLINVELTGEVLVNSASDDDIFGILLGYTSPLQASGDNPASIHSVVFGWKEVAQGTALEGMRLARVDHIEPVPLPSTFAGSWIGNPAPAGVTVLAERTGATEGWVSGQWYTIRAIYRSDYVAIYVDGALMLEASGSFTPGHVGIMNQSQPSVIYRNFALQSIVTGGDDFITRTNEELAGTSWPGSSEHGDPVTTATGSLTDQFVDLDLGLTGTRVVRSYNGLGVSGENMGEHWRVGVGSSLEAGDSGTVIVRTPDGVLAINESRVLRSTKVAVALPGSS